jgi:glycosyltransferase involved in cell wall biosynthesis
MPPQVVNGSAKRIGLYLQNRSNEVGGAEYEAIVLAADLALRHRVEIVHHRTIDLAAVCTKMFGDDLTGVGFRQVEAPPSWPEYLTVPAPPAGAMRTWLKDLSGPYDVFIAFCHDMPPMCYSKVGVMRVLFPFFAKDDIWPFRVEENADGGRLRGALRRWHYNRHWHDRMSRFQVKTANSEYTRSWTQRYWNVDADVIYPPVDRHFAVREKELLILSVGRISAMKRQLELVRAFAELTDLHAAGWRFCVAGGAAASPESQDYVAELRAAAGNAPIDFAVDPDAQTLSRLFERASLFWHAPGLGLDPEQFPAKMEHFGIATVEAMQAGCVPVVINRGGQPEIVRDGVDGLLWSTVVELQAATREAAADESRRAVLASSARQRATKYSRQAFVEGFRQSLRAVL